MSLIHWDKSVLSLHIKEIIEDGHGNNPIALAGLGAIALSAFGVPMAIQLGKPVLKAAIKSSLPVDKQTKILSSGRSQQELMAIWERAAIATRK